MAIATGIPYQEVYDALSEVMNAGKVRPAGKRTPRTGTPMEAAKTYLASVGWEWVPVMKIGSGCTMHLCAEELPGGRIVTRLSRHFCAVVDGEIHDTFDPNDRGVTIYPPGCPQDQIPKGARWLENGNGWAYSPQRCVYGYWRKSA